jgi:carbon monoxide dehydrogenase subunit G
MKITGENVIAAPPEAVWRALNDPEVLRRAIPGCETLEKVTDSSFKATVTTRIGPIQAKFNGQVELTDLDPPNGYTIRGQGSGGVAGSAKGGARVRLAPAPEGTRLTYDADAQVTGKLAQLGSRLIDSTAKMLAGQFFDRFQEIVTAEAAGQLPAAAASKPVREGLPEWVWIAAFAGLVLLVLIFGWR